MCESTFRFSAGGRTGATASAATTWPRRAGFIWIGPLPLGLNCRLSRRSRWTAYRRREAPPPLALAAQVPHSTGSVVEGSDDIFDGRLSRVRSRTSTCAETSASTRAAVVSSGENASRCRTPLSSPADVLGVGDL